MSEPSIKKDFDLARELVRSQLTLKPLSSDEIARLAKQNPEIWAKYAYDSKG